MVEITLTIISIIFSVKWLWTRINMSLPTMYTRGYSRAEAKGYDKKSVALR